MTNFKEQMKLRSHNTMQMRARGLPLVRVAQYKKEIDAAQKANELLMSQLMQVAQQRDTLDRTLRSFYEREAPSGVNK
jgi:hypothetical protein